MDSGGRGGFPVPRTTHAREIVVNSRPRFYHPFRGVSARNVHKCFGATVPRLVVVTGNGTPCSLRPIHRFIRNNDYVLFRRYHVSVIYVRRLLRTFNVFRLTFRFCRCIATRWRNVFCQNVLYPSPPGKRRIRSLGTYERYYHPIYSIPHLIRLVYSYRRITIVRTYTRNWRAIGLFTPFSLYGINRTISKEEISFVVVARNDPISITPNEVRCRNRIGNLT